MANKTQAKEFLTKAFHEVDSNKSGFIEGKELENVLKYYYKSAGKQCPDCGKLKADTEAFMKKVDKNHDNKISLTEFLDYFMPLCC